MFLLRIRFYNLIHVTKLIREPPHSGFRRPLFYLELLFDHRLALGQTQEKPEKQSQLIYFIILHTHWQTVYGNRYHEGCFDIGYY